MLVSVPLLYRDETAAAHSNYDRPHDADAQRRLFSF